MNENAINKRKNKKETERLALQDVPPVLMQYFKGRGQKRTGKYYCYSDNRWGQLSETAHLLADVEDDFPIVKSIDQDNDVYQKMSLPELRSYFTLRVGFRKGIFPKVPTAYIDLYVIETMLLIGVKDVEEAWKTLQAIRQVYIQNMLDKLSLKENAVSPRQYDLFSCHFYHPLFQLDQNIRDFVIFNKLRNHLLPHFENELREDKIIITLGHFPKISDDAIWELLPSMSMYSFTHTIKLLGDAEFVKRAVVKALRNLDTYYRDHKQSDLINKYGYHLCESKYHPLFYDKVFCREDEQTRGVIFVVDEVRRYIWDGHNYYVEYYACPDESSKKSPIYKLLYEIDRQIRAICKNLNMSQKTHYLSAPEMKIVIHSIAQEQKAAEAVRQDAIKREAQQRQAAIDQRSKIDFSKLSTIRSDAAATRDQLLNDEERGLTGVATPPASGKKKATAHPAVKRISRKVKVTQPASSSQPSANLLSPDEQQFLQLLPAGDWRAFLQQKHLMPSVVMEAVNDKLFDTFGDVVLQDIDGQPEVIEDYRVALEALVRTINS